MSTADINKGNILLNIKGVTYILRGGSGRLLPERDCETWLFSVYVQGRGRATANFTPGSAAAAGGARVSVRRSGPANQGRDSMGTGTGSVEFDCILPAIAEVHLMSNLIA